MSQNGSYMYIGCPTLGRRAASLAGAVAALAVTVALAVPGQRADGASTGGASPSSPCREVTCTISFAVGSKVKRWTSPELFFPANEQVMARFRAGEIRHLVTTDVASRGIDIEDVSTAASAAWGTASKSSAAHGRAARRRASA